MLDFPLLTLNCHNNIIEKDEWYNITVFLPKTIAMSWFSFFQSDGMEST